MRLVISRALGNAKQGINLTWPNTFETAEFWCIVGLTAILCLLQMKNFTLQMKNTTFL